MHDFLGEKLLKLQFEAAQVSRRVFDDFSYDTMGDQLSQVTMDKIETHLKHVEFALSEINSAMDFNEDFK